MKKPAAPIAAAVLLLPGVLLLPVWQLGGLGAGEDDILYYLPARQFIHDCAANGVWPTLNPWTGLGRPFLADPQNAVFYPPTWLFAVAPVEVAYPVLLWLHFSLAAGGMYRLLRSEQIARLAALFGALAFAYCGWMLAHRVHFAMHAAAAWTPWVFWRLSRYTAAGGAGRLTALAVVAALQAFAGHVQVTAITALGSLVFMLGRLRVPEETVEQLQSPDPDPTPAWIARGRPLSRWLLGWMCAGGLFSVQLLPTLAYVRECTRVDRTYWDFTENSWNPAASLTWFMPFLLGQRTPNALSDAPWWGPSHQVEQFAYPGIVCLVLGGLALRGSWRGDERRRGWVVLLLFALLLALGKYGPLCPLLYWLPGSNLFRVPARALLLFNFALAALAALAVHELGAPLSPPRARWRAWLQSWTRRPIITAAVIAAVCVVIASIATPFLTGSARAAALATLRPWRAPVGLSLAVLLASFAVLHVVARRWDRPRVLWMLPLILAADLGLVGWTLDVPRGASRVDLVSATRAEPWLRAVRDSGFRLWVVTDTAGVYADPMTKGAANTNTLLGARSLTEYGPLQPAVLGPLFRFAAWGVTAEAERLLLDTAWMRLFNVGWVLVCDESLRPPAGCDLLLTTPQGWRLFRNPSAAGYALFEDPGAAGAVRAFELTPGCWRLHADAYSGGSEAGRQRVVLSCVALPGWRARINGQEAPVEVTDSGLLAVEMPVGRAAEIEWRYWPPGLNVGAALTLVTAILLLSMIVIDRRDRAGGADGPESGGRPAQLSGASGTLIEPEPQAGPMLPSDGPTDVQPQTDRPPIPGIE